MTTIALPSLTTTKGGWPFFGVWLDTRSGASDAAWRKAEEAKFDRLTQAWIDETQGISDIDEILDNDNYQQIISMGWVAVPLILRRLEIAPKQWFWALETITGESIGQNGMAGDVASLAQAWLEWGKARGFI